MAIDITDNTPEQYEDKKTPSSTALFRKINLNVDIATQAELISVYNDLTAQINGITSGTLTDYYTKNEADAISTSINNDLTAETSRAQAAEQAIRDSLSDYTVTVGAAELSTTTDGADYDAYHYRFYQGGVEVGAIDVARDQFVESASFAGTVLTLTLRGGQTLTTDLGTIADYTGGTTDTAAVSIDANHVVTVAVNDTISATAVATAEAYADGLNDALTARINGLSATYASKTVVDTAATTLDAAVTAKALTAYQDIDEIITELETLKAAVKVFAGSMKTA